MWNSGASKCGKPNKARVQDDYSTVHNPSYIHFSKMPTWHRNKNWSSEFVEFSLRSSKQNGPSLRTSSISFTRCFPAFQPFSEIDLLKYQDTDKLKIAGKKDDNATKHWAAKDGRIQKVHHPCQRGEGPHAHCLVDSCGLEVLGEKYQLPNGFERTSQVSRNKRF